MDSPLYGYECCTFLIFANFEEITNTKTGAYIVNRFKSNKSMIINNNEIVIKPIQEEDIPLFDKKYGGSANTISTLFGSMFLSTFNESPCINLKLSSS